MLKLGAPFGLELKKAPARQWFFPQQDPNQNAWDSEPLACAGRRHSWSEAP